MDTQHAGELAVRADLFDRGAKPDRMAPARGAGARHDGDPDRHDRGHDLWILSDLRVDLAPFVVPDHMPAVDAILVGGNVCPGVSRALHWLADSLRRGRADTAVLFVPGPVEFSDGVPVDEALAEGRLVASRLGIELLHDESVRLEKAGDGLHVLGATMWPSFSLTGASKASQARAHARHGWRALRKMVASGGLPLAPHDLAGAHARSRAFVEDALASIVAGGEGARPSSHPAFANIRPGDRALVLSAFPPCRACLPADRASPLLDPWAAAWQGSELDELFERWSAPAGWIFGGTPYSWDVRLGRTRVLANPRNLRHPLSGFDPGRVVTI